MPNVSACVSNSRDNNTKEAFISPHFSPHFHMSMHSLGLRHRSGLRSDVEAVKLAGILFIQNMRNLHVLHAGSRSIFIRFCSGKKLPVLETDHGVNQHTFYLK